ncbi:MAG: helix-turn-helix transcriptional regulator [Clostridia bacterium]
MPKAAGINQKLKLLYMAKIFEEETDEEHMLTIYDICDRLSKYEINSSRKVAAEDIALLTQFGMDIITDRSKRSARYYLGQRRFEIPELKLLADSVSSARFITEKKSRSLLKKLEALAGRFRGQEINRRVYVANRVKSGNEMIYINIDVISRAIDEGRQIKFRYFDYTVDKKKKYREGARVCSPYALTWNDGNYYLVAHYEKYGGDLSNFRVDRMEGVQMTDEKSVPMPEDFDLAEYANTSFSMFSGAESTVKLSFDEKLVNAVIDKFGTDIIMIPDGNGRFTVNTKVKTGAAFYGWLFQFGAGAQIMAPENIRREFGEMLEKVSTYYTKEVMK